MNSGIRCKSGSSFMGLAVNAGLSISTKCPRKKKKWQLSDHTQFLTAPKDFHKFLDVLALPVYFTSYCCFLLLGYQFKPGCHAVVRENN